MIWTLAAALALAWLEIVDLHRRLRRAERRHSVLLSALAHDGVIARPGVMP